MTNVLRASIVALILLVTTALAPAQTDRQSLTRSPGAAQVAPRTGVIAYVTVEGSRQGRFKGQSAAGHSQYAVPVLAFTYEGSVPRDNARVAGASSGRRVHGPVVITKPVGAASPQFFTAMTTDESLKSVVLEFVRTDSTGAEEVFYTIKLSGASVSRFRQYASLPGGGSAGGLGLLEEVAIAFQRIEVVSKDGATAAVDDVGR
jgi:type VI secretion system secreted protein Hcp